MTRPPTQQGTPVTNSPAAAQPRGQLAWLGGVRDRIDRDYAQPLEVPALVGMPPSTYRRQAAQATTARPPAGRAGDPTGQESRSTGPPPPATMDASDGPGPRPLRLGGRQQPDQESPIGPSTTRSSQWHP